MIKQSILDITGALALVAGLAAAGPAGAVINLGPQGDNLLNGAFNQLSFGAAGRANVAPLLYFDDKGDTAPPSTAIVGYPELTYGYEISGLGTSIATITYSITNDEFSAGPYNDLRLMVATRVKGDPAALDTAGAVGFGGAAGPGQAVQFRILDVAAGDPLVQIINADNLDGSNACGAGCFPEMALQWNRASLSSGETWTVSFQLIDDPSLVSGGRYLQSTSLGAGAASLIVGNPVPVPEPGTYAMLFAGLGLLALARKRRHAIA